MRHPRDEINFHSRVGYLIAEDAGVAEIAAGADDEEGNEWRRRAEEFVRSVSGPSGGGGKSGIT